MSGKGKREASSNLTSSLRNLARSPATFVQERTDMDELAEAHKHSGGRASKLLALVLLISFGVGIYCIIDLAVVFWPQVKSYLLSLGVVDWVAQNVGTILLFTILVLLTATVSGMIVVRLSREHGVGLVKFSMYAAIVVPWVLFLVFMLFLSSVTGLNMFQIFGDPLLLLIPLMPLALFTVIGLALLLRMRDKVERAGIMLRMSGKLLSEEKELFLPPLLMVILTFLTFISAAAFGASFYLHFITPVADPLVPYAVLIAVEFLFLLLIIVITYSMDGIVIAIAHIWYRKRDPKFRDGRVIVWSKLGRIAGFGVLAALVKTIIMALMALASRSRNAGAIVYRATGNLIGSIWYYVNYFTLPILVLEDLSIKDSIKNSAKRLYHNFGDVLVREFGVGSAMGALELLVVGIFAVSGLYFSILIGLTGWSILVGVLAFVIMSGMATYPVFRAMRVSYLAVLFTYIWDKETGFQGASRMPENIKTELDEWYQTRVPLIRSEERDLRKGVSETKARETDW